MKNNFDFLRLLFAILVIVTHSFALTGLNDWQHDWLAKWTKGQATFSYLGVRGFFVISGYLIFQSMTRSKSLVDYFWKRILRIFPALIVVLLLTVVLAVFPYPYPITRYIHDHSVATYFFNNISLYRLQYSINGVFEDVPEKGYINGSLWTIPYEFTFYILLSSFLLIKKENAKYVLVILFILGLTIFFTPNLRSSALDLDTKFMADLGLFFAAGALLAAFEIEKIRKKRLILLLALVLLLLSWLFRSFLLLQFFSLPVLVILSGLSSTKYLNSVGSKTGDLSYGIYIYAYPVQQTLEHYFRLNYWQLLLSTLPVTFILAYLSWHIIEKRALLLKNTNISNILRQWSKGGKAKSQMIQNK